MKALKKVTAILCAAVLAGGVCAACACGGGGDQSGFHKPEIPAGVDKVSADIALEMVKAYDKVLDLSTNVTCDEYAMQEGNGNVTYIEEGVTYSSLEDIKTEGTRNSKYLETKDKKFGDLDYEITGEHTLVVNGQPDENYESKYNLTSETRLRDDTYYEKYTNYETVENGKVPTVEGAKKPLPGLKSFAKIADYYNSGDIVRYSDIYNMLMTYLSYLEEGDYYYPNGDSSFYNPIPKSVVKTFEVDVRFGGAAFYFSYNLETEDEYDLEEGRHCITTQKEVYVLAVNAAAGLTESNFEEAEITEEDVKEVLYVNPDMSEIAAKLKAGEPIEIVPIGGGDVEKLEVWLIVYSGDIARLTYSDGKFVLDGKLAYDGKTEIDIQASYDKGECYTKIEYYPNNN